MKHSATPANADKKTKLTNKQIGIEVILLIIIMLSIYLFISLISFDPSDPGWSQTAWHEPIRNMGGIVGAYLSDIFLQFFGFIAYCIPACIVVFCIQSMLFFYRENLPINFFSLSLRVIGLMAFIFGATGFFALNIQDPLQYQAGGIIGDIVKEEVLLPLGHIGASIILFAISFACITLLTGFSWLLISEKIGEVLSLAAKYLFISLRHLFSRKKQHKDHDNHEEESQLTIEFGINEEQEHLVKQAESKTPVSSQIEEFSDSSQSDTEIEIVETNIQEYETRMTKASIENEELENYLTINENVLPSAVLSEHNHKSEINPDYYSPISPLSEVEPVVTKEIDEQEDIASIGSYLQTEYQENSMNENSDTDNQSIPVISEYKTKQPKPTTQKDDENEEESLIHPLLRRQDKQRQKPTTPLPSLNLLTAPPVKQIEVDHNALKNMAELIEKSLADFRVKVRVVGYLPGPVITRFEIELAPGVKASRITSLDRDLARSLSMPSVRVVEVIPGKPYVGIELPNKNRQTVYFREVLDSPQFKEAKSPLTTVLGKDISGQSVVADLAKMPHLLVAGTTGSGKSVGVNAMILSILYKSQPEEVRFIMIDPKMLELSVYEGIPHLLTEVVTDMKDAANALNWCVNEMERRYRLMSALGVRNIAGYNEKIEQAAQMGRPIPDPLWRPGDSMDIDMPTLEKLPYIVVMVDEFADLIMAVGKKVEELIARLAQKARAAGIHLVLATQRPSVDVITGLIKANIPTRIAFTVSSKIDSRTILDQMGAESLLGMGDMLYLAPNSSIPIRVHGAFVRDEEVHSVVQDWKARGTPSYIENITASTGESDSDGFDTMEEELDPLFDQVVAFVIEKKRASISSVQRQFRIGYNRAARIVEQMEMQQIVSPPSHNGNREVLAKSIQEDY